jgi:hypothetical protein
MRWTSQSPKGTASNCRVLLGGPTCESFDLDHANLIGWSKGPSFLGWPLADIWKVVFNSRKLVAQPLIQRACQMICIQECDVILTTKQESTKGFQAGIAEILDKVSHDVRAGKFGGDCDLDIKKIFASIEERMSVGGYPVFEARSAKPR